MTLVLGYVGDYTSQLLGYVTFKTFCLAKNHQKITPFGRFVFLLHAFSHPHGFRVANYAIVKTPGFLQFLGPWESLETANDLPTQEGILGILG